MFAALGLVWEGGPFKPDFGLSGDFGARPKECPGCPTLVAFLSTGWEQMPGASAASRF
jgi:hypothetical protein